MDGVDYVSGTKQIDNRWLRQGFWAKTADRVCTIGERKVAFFICDYRQNTAAGKPGIRNAPSSVVA